MATKLDSRQTEHRSNLPRLSDQLKPTLKQILPNLDAEITPIFELRESATPDLILNVGESKIVNSDTGLTKTMSPVQNTFFDFSSGTVTFPASSGGNIVVSPGTGEALTLSSGNFKTVLIQIDSSGQLSVSQGSEAANSIDAQNTANFPTHSTTSLPIGYIVVENVAGTIQNVTNENITQFVGGGSGGVGGSTYDIFFQDNFETTKSTDLLKGKDATFDNGGVLGGALSDETVSPISGTRSIKYITNATPANSTNDFFYLPAITLDPKQKGETVGINLYYSWNGSDDLIEVVIWDDTNNAKLNSSTDTLTLQSDSTRYSNSVTIPATCNSIKVGFHHVGASESSKTLIFDDVEMSSDPFVYKQLSNDTDWEDISSTVGAIAGTGGGTLNVGTGGGAEYTVETRRNGTNAEIRYTVRIGTAGTSDVTGSYVFPMIPGETLVPSLGSYETVGKGSITIVASALPVARLIARQFSGGFLIDKTDAAVEGAGGLLFNNANVVSLIVSVPIQGWTTTTEHVVTPTSSVAPVRYTLATAKNMVNSASTVIDFETLAYDDDSLVTTGTSWEYIIPKTGYYKINARIMLQTTTTWAENEICTLDIYKGGFQYSSISRVNGRDFSAGTEFISVNGSDTIYALKDEAVDVRCYQNSGGDLNTHTNAFHNHITIEPVAPTALLAAIPTNYRNVNPNILINGDCRVNERGLVTLDAAESATLNAKYKVDMWVMGFDTVGVTTVGIEYLSTNQPSELSGSRSIRFTSSTAGSPTGFMQINQQIEDFALYAGKTVTLSAYVNSNTTDARLRLFDGVATAEGTGHSGTGTTGTPVWERLSITMTLRSSITELRNQLMVFNAGNVTINDNDFIEFTGAKLELGSVVTEFQASSYERELDACQRYCYVIQNESVSGVAVDIGYARDVTNCYFSLRFPKNMYVIPTASLSGAASNYRLITGATGVGAVSAIGFTTTAVMGKQVAPLAVTASGMTAGTPYQLEFNVATDLRIIFEANL